MKAALETVWNREERSKPRNIAGLAAYYQGCGVPISRRYIDDAIKRGGYKPEYGNLTTADHFLAWKSTASFVCRFKKATTVETAPPSRRPARSAARADKLGE